MGELAGTVAVVTGAAQGIGAACALALARAGATVIVADLDGVAARTTAANIAAATKTAVTTAEVDVADAEQCHDLIAVAAEHHGHVDILVNCAAVVAMKSALELSVDDWQRIFSVGVYGAFACAQAYAHQVIAGGNGSYSDSQRNDIAKDLQGRLEFMLGLSNSAATCDCSSNAAGSCTFGPTGNTMQRNLQSGDFPGVTLGDLTDGAPIFGFESRRGARIFTASTEEEAIVLTGANGLSAQVVHNARGRIRLCGNFGGYNGC